MSEREQLLERLVEAEQRRANVRQPSRRDLRQQEQLAERDIVALRARLAQLDGRGEAAQPERRLDVRCPHGHPVALSKHSTAEGMWYCGECDGGRNYYSRDEVAVGCVRCDVPLPPEGDCWTDDGEPCCAQCVDISAAQPEQRLTFEERMQLADERAREQVRREAQPEQGDDGLTAEEARALRLASWPIESTPYSVLEAARQKLARIIVREESANAEGL